MALTFYDSKTYSSFLERGTLGTNSITYKSRNMSPENFQTQISFNPAIRQDRVLQDDSLTEIATEKYYNCKTSYFGLDPSIYFKQINGWYRPLVETFTANEVHCLDCVSTCAGCTACNSCYDKVVGCTGCTTNCQGSCIGCDGSCTAACTGCNLCNGNVVYSTCGNQCNEGCLTGCTSCDGCTGQEVTTCSNDTGSYCNGCTEGCQGGCETFCQGCTSNVTYYDPSQESCGNCDGCNNCTACTACNGDVDKLNCKGDTGCTNCTGGCTTGTTTQTNLCTSCIVSCTNTCQNGQNGLVPCSSIFSLASSSACEQGVSCTESYSCKLNTAVYSCVGIVTCANNNSPSFAADSCIQGFTEGCSSGEHQTLTPAVFHCPVWIDSCMRNVTCYGNCNTATVGKDNQDSSATGIQNNCGTGCDGCTACTACNGGCTGPCVSCNGCQGCTSNCTSGCTTSCTESCTSNCAAGCTTSTTGCAGCTTSTTGCAGCTTACTSCTSCAGCTGGCTTSCTAGCTSSCTTGCEGCTTFCGECAAGCQGCTTCDGCTTGCTSGCTIYCQGNCLSCTSVNA